MASNAPHFAREVEAMKVAELTEAERAHWLAWVQSLPQKARAVAEQFWPNELYRLQSTAQRVMLQSFNTDGTVRVAVLAAYNPLRLSVDKSVFGVNPNDLEALPESEHAVIAAEEAQAKRVMSERDDLRAFLRTPAGIQLQRHIIQGKFEKN